MAADRQAGGGEAGGSCAAAGSQRALANAGAAISEDYYAGRIARTATSHRGSEGDTLAPYRRISRSDHRRGAARLAHRLCQSCVATEEVAIPAVGGRDGMAALRQAGGGEAGRGR